MNGFYEDFFDNLTADELRSIFFVARQSSLSILANPVCQEFPAEDARIMALSLGVAAELLKRFENSNQ